MSYQKPQHREQQPTQQLLENGLTLQQQYRYLQDVIEGKSNGKWLYEWAYKNDPHRSGMSMYLDAVNNPEYSNLFAQQEQALLAQLAPEISKIIASSKTKRIVHLGPGDGETFATCLAGLPQHIQQALHEKVYIPADISPQSIKLAGEKMSNKHKMRIDPFVGDWLETDHIKSIQHKFVMFEGCTWGNFNEDEQKQLLENLGTGTDFTRDALLMTYFVAPDPTAPDYAERVVQLVQGYSNPGVKNRVMAGLHELGVDITKLDFVVEYEAKTYFNWHDITYEAPACIKVGAKVKEGEVLRIIMGNLEMQLPAGTTPFWVITSRRYDPKDIEQFCKEQGWKTQKHVSAGDVGAMLLKGKTGVHEGLDRHKGKIKTALLTALLTGGAWGANHLWDAHTAQKKIEAKIAYNIQFKNANMYLDRFVTDNDAPEKKLERVYQLADNMVTILKTRYSSFDFPSDQELRNALALLLSQKDHLTFFRDSDREWEAMVEFVDHVFWPSYTSSTAALEHTVLYEHLAPYESMMQDLLDHPRDLTIPEEQTISKGLKGLLHHPKVRDMDILGTYIDGNGNMYELAVAEKILTGEGTYPQLNGEKQLVARQIWGDTPAFGTFTSKSAHTLSLDYFKRGYVDQLAMQLVALPLDENQKRSLANKYAIKMHHGELFQLLTDILITLNRQGYDFSYLLEDNATELQKRFLYSFLTDYTGLTQEQHTILTEYHITQSSETKEVSLSQAIDRLTTYLDTYFFSGRRGGEQNLFGLKKELTREMLQDQYIESTYQRLTDDAACFNYLYERKDLCALYGFQLHTWQDFQQWESGFRKLLTGGMSQIDEEVIMLGELNYFNNFYRCADGRVYSVAGNWDALRALEITSTNNHNALAQCLPELKEEITKRRGKGFWSLEGSNRGERSKSEEAIRFINKEFIPFSQDEAIPVAEDYFNQKYGEKIADELSTYLLETCSPGKKELHGAVKQLLSRTIAQLYLDDILSAQEIDFAKHDENYRIALLHYFIVPKCKDTIEKLMGIDIGGELPYASAEQLQYLPNAIHEFLQGFGVSKNRPKQLENNETSDLLSMSVEQQHIAQAILKTISKLKQNEWNFSTPLGRYKFFMEHNELFNAIGYVYHDPYFGYLGHLEDEVLHQSKDNVLINIEPTMHKVMRFIVSPSGKRYQLIYTQNALGNDHIFARPVFTQQERADKMVYLGIKFTERYGGGQIAAAQSDRVASQFDEKYVWRRLSHAQDLFKELVAVYGDDVFDRIRFMDDAGTTGH